jgi:UDPglucose--hexose-1-phosphate uridylyltransferase
VNEIRQDLVTEEWVVYSPKRAQRPQINESKDTKSEHLPGSAANCPFCPGNESRLPSIIQEIPAIDDKDWQNRVVPNKYPVLTPEGEITGTNRGIYLTAAAYGVHEVIIESPLHNQDIPMMSEKEIETLIETYSQRHSHVYRAHNEVAAVIIFRNHGPHAGTSLRHPHSQLIASGIIPHSVSHKERIAKDYFSLKNRCVMCDILKSERSDEDRIVYENELFLTFVPFAAKAPFEMWIVPRRHCSDFGLVSAQERADLARALGDALQRYRDVIGDPDYNYVIHSYSRQPTMVQYLHWYIQIQPRLTTPAGFEMGSGMHVNPSLPEDNAEILREQYNR